MRWARTGIVHYRCLLLCMYVSQAWEKLRSLYPTNQLQELQDELTLGPEGNHRTSANVGTSRVVRQGFRAPETLVKMLW